MGFFSRFDRVLAVGRDSYIRVYPNPGIGLCFGKRRIAISWRGGIEIFHKHPSLIWQRNYAKFSRIKRPGSKV